MPKKQPPRVQLNFEPDPDPIDVNPETGESNPNFIYDDDDDDDVNYGDDDSVIDPVKNLKLVEKEQINETDIFDNSDDEGEPLPPRPPPRPQPEPEQKKPKTNKNGKTRKPMSEEHKMKLAQARIKAMEARKKKAIENKNIRELEREEKELLKIQRVKRVDKLKRDVIDSEDDIPKAEPKAEPKINYNGLTKKDLEDAQLEAITKYDTLRKMRKAEKRHNEMIEREKAQLIQKLQPNNYKYRDGSNRWDVCY